MENVTKTAWKNCDVYAPLPKRLCRQHRAVLRLRVSSASGSRIVIRDIPIGSAVMLQGKANRGYSDEFSGDPMGLSSIVPKRRANLRQPCASKGSFASIAAKCSS